MPQLRASFMIIDKLINEKTCRLSNRPETIDRHQWHLVHFKNNQLARPQFGDPPAPWCDSSMRRQRQIYSKIARESSMTWNYSKVKCNRPPARHGIYVQMCWAKTTKKKN